MNRVVVTKEQFDKMMEMAGACIDRKSNRDEYRGLICALVDGKFTVGASNGKILQRMMVEVADYTLEGDEWVFEFSVDGISKTKGIKPIEIRQARDGDIEVIAKDDYGNSTIWVRKDMCTDKAQIKKLMRVYERFAVEELNVVMLDVALLEKVLKAYKKNGVKGVLIGVGEYKTPVLMTSEMSGGRIDSVVLPMYDVTTGAPALNGEEK